MDVNKRQMGQHVEYELDDWRSAFYLDMRLIDIFTPLENDMARTLDVVLGTHKAPGDQAESAEAEMVGFEAASVSWPQIHALIRDQVRFLLDLVRSDGIEWQTTAFKAQYCTLLLL
jgi:hypothetical protein